MDELNRILESAFKNTLNFEKPSHREKLYK